MLTDLITAIPEDAPARLDGWEAADVEPFFGKLSAFAADAAAKGKRLLLWVCL